MTKFTMPDFQDNIFKRERLLMRLACACLRLFASGNAASTYRLGLEVLRRKYPLPRELGLPWRAD